MQRTTAALSSLLLMTQLGICMEHIRYPVSICECVRITSNFCIQKIEVSDKKPKTMKGIFCFCHYRVRNTLKLRKAHNYIHTRHDTSLNFVTFRESNTSTVQSKSSQTPTCSRDVKGTMTIIRQTVFPVSGSGRRTHYQQS